MKRLETYRNIAIPYGHRNRLREVSPDDVKMNQEAIRTRSGEVWSMYPAVHGERKIYLIQGFRGSEDIGLFCFVGEL